MAGGFDLQTPLDFRDQATPSAPGAGRVLLYSVSGEPCIRAGAAGAETKIILASGGTMTGGLQGTTLAEGGALIANSQISSIADAATKVPFRGRGASAQTASLAELQDSAGALRWSVGRDGREPDPRNTAYIKDEFMSGQIVTSGTIGDLGWTLSIVSTGTIAHQAGAANRPGLLILSSGTTNGGKAQLHLWSAATTGSVLPADFFDIMFIANPNQSSNVTYRLGLGNDASAIQPNNGIYFESTGGSAAWVGVCRSASSESLTGTVAAIGTGGYSRMRIRRIDATTIGFTVGDGVELTLNTNVPTTHLSPFIMVTMITGGVAKTLIVDYFDLLITGLTR